MAKLILIADDDDDDALAIGETLASVGIKNSTKTVKDGTEVIAYFAGQGKFADREQFPIPSVLLLDLKMPKIGGFSVLEWLNEQKLLKNGPLVVVLTGHGEIDSARRAYSLGARSFLAKPCRVEDMKNLVRAYPAYWEMEKA